MVTLTIPDLDDAVYNRLRTRAERNRRSPEAEARDIIGAQTTAGGGMPESAPPAAAAAGATREDEFDAWLAELAAFRAEMVTHYGVQPDSLPGIRADREAM